MITSDSKQKNTRRRGLYIHIPFCRRKCNYCGFLSFQEDSRQGMDDSRERYVNSLCLEFDVLKKLNGLLKIDTVFIGGGTPSLLKEEDISRIFESAQNAFDIDDDAEITIETNPGTLTESKLRRYRRLGINRLSIGLQSFDDDCLKTLGRIHSEKDFISNYLMARKLGFSNINIDLMFGFPGHTMPVWKNSIEKAVELRPEHISFYSMQLEEGTPFYKAYKDEKINMVSDEMNNEMYHFAQDALKEAGYKHYEISNASLPGFECRHNLKYWNMDEYLGTGLGAHSYINGKRFHNTSDIIQYSKMIEEGKVPVLQADIKADTSEDAMSIFVFTGLRKLDGISLLKFREKFGVDFYEVYKDRQEIIEYYIKNKLLEREDGRIRLTREGIDVSNDIMCEFLL